MNPFKFGMVGSDGRPHGAGGRRGGQFLRQALRGRARAAPLGARRHRGPGDRSSPSWAGSRRPAAMPAVWATENTREAIFDAMKRKETYATTGPRMTVRFFGGWDFTRSRRAARLPADAGYAKGVPMGGDLREAPAGQVADLPGGRAEGPDRRQSRPHPDRQGLAGRQAARPRRRSMTSSGAATASPARTASCRRSATRSTSRTRPGPTPSAHPS